MKALFTLFLLRLSILVLIASLAGKFIPYLGFFPYKEIIESYSLPHFIYAFANFDGAHYISIARDGYHAYEQAFFPLYPILIRMTSIAVAGNHLLAALLVSNISFFGGMVFFYKVIAKRYKIKIANWSLVFLLTFPTAFFFNAVYTEGLFLLLFAATLFTLQSKKYVKSSILAATASATRLIGTLLIIPFAAFLMRKHRIYLTFPFVGLALYATYLYQTTGDPLFFLTSQPAFGANRSTSIILLPQVYFRYFKIFFMSDISFAYMVSIFEFAVFNFVLFVSWLFLKKAYKKKDQFGISIAIFSLANLILPTLTGTFSSIPRYALFSPALFLYLAFIKSERLKYLTAFAFVISQIIVLGFFVQGYFVS